MTEPRLDTSAKKYVPRKKVEASKQAASTAKPGMVTPQSPTFQKLVFWKPSDHELGIDETFCIENIPDEYWSKYGSLEETKEYFEKFMGIQIA